jgi:hypothetical protein
VQSTGGMSTLDRRFGDYPGNFGNFQLRCPAPPQQHPILPAMESGIKQPGISVRLREVAFHCLTKL